MIKYVLLLRAPDEDAPDRYEAVFGAKGFVPLSLPVLETVLVHVDTLRDKIVRGPNAQGLSGVILTSKRAVEAWCEALRSITETAQGVLHDVAQSLTALTRGRCSGLADSSVLCRRGRNNSSYISNSCCVPVFGVS